MYYDRDISTEFVKNIENEYVLIVVGARQTGKTTFLKYIFNEIKESENKYFINLENPEFLDLLNQHPDNIFKLTNIPSAEKQIIFIDEIQYLENPSNFLKYIYDEYKGIIKLVVSGSSSFYIDHKFKDSLVGRKKLFQLYTLNFDEFLRFKNELEIIKELKQRGKVSLINNRKLEQLINEYIIYGGYPGVVLEANYENKKILLSEIGTDYIKKDVFEANIQDQAKYFYILKTLANQVGSLVNSSELANTYNVAVTTVEKYLYIMQKSFHVALIRPFFSNIRKELTKMPKSYFYDLGLRNYFSGKFDNIQSRIDKGMILENAYFREFLFKYSLDNIKFWRTQNQNEVDFIINEKIAYEIKFLKTECRKSKYKLFQRTYPDIKFEFLTYQDFCNLKIGPSMEVISL